MKYPIVVVLIFASLFSLTSLSTPVGATSTVSGEVSVSSSKKNVALKARLAKERQKVLDIIAKIQADIGILDTQIQAAEKSLTTLTSRSQIALAQMKIQTLKGKKMKFEKKLITANKMLVKVDLMIAKANMY